MAGRGAPVGGPRPLPLRRGESDRRFWTKLAALWHRERMREAYVAAGDSRSEARHRANREALEIANRNGWKVGLARFKADLAEFVATELPARGGGGRGRTIRFWEEQVHADLLKLLAGPAQDLQRDLLRYLKREAATHGRFSGREGFYRLAHIVSHVPTSEHLEQRNAYIAALSEIGYDPDCCDEGTYRIVLRLLREQTHRPFESRLGRSMPLNEPRRPLWARLLRRSPRP